MQLAENIEMLEDHLGNKCFIVVPAYFAVLLPWGFMQKADFISSTWKTVQRTRRNGLIQFWLTLIPISFMTLYIFLQAGTEDFKEMCAAALAFVFALPDLFRTWWGLWQLRIFRDWAERSIRSLASQGVSHEPFMSAEDEKKLKGMKPNDYYTFTTDSIQVNETIIDNQIMGGETKCYIKRNLPKNYRKLFGKVLEYILRFISSPLHSARIIFRNFIEYFRVRQVLTNTDATKWLFDLEPKEPTEVWVRWGTSFASQGLSKWI